MPLVFLFSRLSSCVNPGLTPVAAQSSATHIHEKIRPANILFYIVEFIRAKQREEAQQ